MADHDHSTIQFTKKHLYRLSNIASRVDLLGTLTQRAVSLEQRSEVSRLYKNLSDQVHVFFAELRELFRTR